MKKISLFLMALLFVSSFAMAETEQEHHSKIRNFISSDFNLMENPETSTMTGMFKKMSVFMEKITKKKKVSYKGWVIKNGKKLPLSLFYKDKKLHGNFNGNKFSYVSMNGKKQFYTFKTAKGETKISYLYEMRDGHRMGNPLFVIKNNKRKYLVQLKNGGCCAGHGLYYAAVMYGLTTFDEVGKRVKGSGDKVENKKKAKEDHKH